MKIICAGYWKTGTKTVTKALSILGYTVYDWEEQAFDFIDHWCDVFENGTMPDVRRVYENADAIVDMPGVFFFEEIMEAFPGCKVILTERDEEAWWISLQHMLTTRNSTPIAKRFLGLLSPTGRKLRYITNTYLDAFIGSTNIKSEVVFRKRFRIHNHRVKTFVQPERLLILDVQQGWKPLCDFLGCDVPSVPFPHENVKSEILKTAMTDSRCALQVRWEVWKNLVLLLSGLIAIVAMAVFLYAFRI